MPLFFAVFNTIHTSILGEREKIWTKIIYASQYRVLNWSYDGFFCCLRFLIWAGRARGGQKPPPPENSLILFTNLNPPL